MLPNPSKSIAVPNAQSVVVDLTESTDDETNSPPHTSKPSLPPNLASLDLMCQGIHLEFPDGQFPGGSYPFLLHDVKQLRWGYEYRQGRFYLRSNQCKGAASHGTKQCKACQHIDLDDGWLEGIRARLQNGVPRRAPNAYKPIGVLTAQNRQLRDSFDSKRLALFSAHVRLGVKSKKIDLHKRLVMAIADGGVRRVDAVLRVSLRNGKGLGTVIDLVHKAAAGVYAQETRRKQNRRSVYLCLGWAARASQISHTERLAWPRPRQLEIVDQPSPYVYRYLILPMKSSNIIFKSLSKLVSSPQVNQKSLRLQQPRLPLEAMF